MIWSLTALLMATQPSTTSTNCAAYVGQKPAMKMFDELWNSLPQVELQGRYESSAAYQQRLAAIGNNGPVIVRGTHSDNGIAYNADSGELTIYDRALGIGRINYADIFGYGTVKGMEDNFTGAAGFMLEELQTARELVPATNGFGARFDIQRTSYTRRAVWAHAGLLGKSVLEGAKPYKPIAKLPVTSSVAEDIVERSYPALLAQPRAPFRATGTSATRATFSRPYETVADVSVILADVKCAFMVRGSGEIFMAFAVK